MIARSNEDAGVQRDANEHVGWGVDDIYAPGDIAKITTTIRCFREGSNVVSSPIRSTMPIPIERPLLIDAGTFVVVLGCVGRNVPAIRYACLVGTSVRVVWSCYMVHAERGDRDVEHAYVPTLGGSWRLTSPRKNSVLLSADSILIP